ncbi:hypothetical protein Ais01nite_29240 [Asanoa ishikariensis]|uniref:DUF4190 domain-containing protein n=1 Tax=Asanoa ishikariensis TaxID=137265 RepID=A0A1H3QLZ8_9ACTN|nr:DUF4190 domain-containing protein [Asanoa ishikariensis]GIF64889.1 hypothetical protein Ais01nite_29240 [Asanoa ishikariensis]SDZ14397.1 protein of unknown function [Asanoa ishikariensis]
MSYPPPPNQPDPYQPGQPYDPQQSAPPSYGPPQSGPPSYGPPISGQPAPDPYGQYPPAVQPGYPAGYPQQAYAGGYPQQRRTSVMAILALVLGILIPPAGIVLGHIAKKQLRTSGEDGAGLATAGLIIGYVLTGLYVLGCCGVIGLGMLSSNTTSVTDTGY